MHSEWAKLYPVSCGGIFVSSLITATIVIVITIVIHIGVWFYKRSRSNKVGHQGNSNKGVYEKMDDKAATLISMTTNEAYIIM